MNSRPVVFVEVPVGAGHPFGLDFLEYFQALFKYGTCIGGDLPYARLMLEILH
jgi:hypothetical protein